MPRAAEELGWKNWRRRGWTCGEDGGENSSQLVGVSMVADDGNGDLEQDEKGNRMARAGGAEYGLHASIAEPSKLQRSSSMNASTFVA